MSYSEAQTAMDPKLKKLEAERRKTLKSAVAWVLVPAVVTATLLAYFGLKNLPMELLAAMCVGVLTLVLGIMRSLRITKSFRQKLRRQVLAPLIQGRFPEADTSSGQSAHSSASFLKSHLLMDSENQSISNFHENSITHIDHKDLGRVQYSDVEVQRQAGKYSEIVFDGLVAHFKTPLPIKGQARFEAPRRGFEVFPWKVLVVSLLAIGIFAGAIEYMIWVTPDLNQTFSLSSPIWKLRGFYLVMALVALGASVYTFSKRRKIASNILKTSEGLWWSSDDFSVPENKMPSLGKNVNAIYSTHKQVVVCCFQKESLTIGFPKINNFMETSLLGSITSGKHQRIWTEQLDLIEDVAKTLRALDEELR